MVIADPADAEARVVRLATPLSRLLKDQQYQLVVVRDGGRRLSEQQAHARRGEPAPAAVWRPCGQWVKSAWCTLDLQTPP